MTLDLATFCTISENLEPTPLFLNIGYAKYDKGIFKLVVQDMLPGSAALWTTDQEPWAKKRNIQRELVQEDIMQNFSEE